MRPLSTLPRSLCAVLPLFLAASAQAQELQQIACHFTTECMDTEACEVTDYTMTLRYQPDPSQSFDASPDQPPAEPFTVHVSDINGDFKAAPITDGSFAAPMTGFISFNGEETQSLLTIGPEGKARYSIHMRSADMALYYEGSCAEDAK